MDRYGVDLNSCDEEPQNIRYTQAGQTITTRRFSGTQAQINDKVTELYALGYDCDVTQGPNWKLVATLTVNSTPDDPGGSDDPEDRPVWAMRATVTNVGLWDCGRPLVQGIPTAVKEMIEARIKNPNQIVDFGIPPAFMTLPLWAAHDRLVAMRRMDIEGRQGFYWTLSRTVTIDQDYEDLTWTIANVEKVLSTEKVKALYNVPLGYARMMPASRAEYENQSFSAATSPVLIPFFYGWLEQPPDFQPVGRGESQVTQTWVYNKWSVTNGGIPGLYDLVA